MAEEEEREQGQAEVFHLDIISLILSRLPMRVILRCKSVCKSWLSLIRSPYFVHEQLHYSSSIAKPSHFLAAIEWTAGLKSPLLLIDDNNIVGTTSCMDSASLWGNSLDETPLVPAKPCITVRFFNSCDGLLCFHEWPSNVRPEGIIRVLNPATRNSLDFLLPLFWEENRCVTWFSYIVFDPSSFLYKLLFVTCELARRVWTPLVWTLGKDVCWRRLDSFEAAKDGSWRRQNPCVFWLPLHGVPYGHWNIARHDDTLPQTLVFDPQGEDFRSIRLPDEVATRVSKHPCAFQGSLYLFCSVKLKVDLIEVWMMKGLESNEWTKEGDYDVRSIYPERIDFEKKFIIIEALAVIHEGIVLKFAGTGAIKFCGIYDPVRKELRRYLSKFMDGAELIGTYVESLIDPIG